MKILPILLITSTSVLAYNEIEIATFKTLGEARAIDNLVPNYCQLSNNSYEVAGNLYTNNLLGYINNSERILQELIRADEILDGIIERVLSTNSVSELESPRGSAKDFWEWMKNIATFNKCRIYVSGDANFKSSGYYDTSGIGICGHSWSFNVKHKGNGYYKGSWGGYGYGELTSNYYPVDIGCKIGGPGGSVEIKLSCWGIYWGVNNWTGWAYPYFSSSSASGSGSSGQIVKFSGSSKEGYISYTGTVTDPDYIPPNIYGCQCNCDACKNDNCHNCTHGNCHCKNCRCPSNGWETEDDDSDPDKPKPPPPPDPPKHECHCGEDAECCSGDCEDCKCKTCQCDPDDDCCDGDCEECHCKDCTCSCESCQNGDCSGCTHIDCNPEEENCECGACTCDKCPDCYGDYSCCDCRVCHLRNCNKGKKVGLLCIGGARVFNSPFSIVSGIFGGDAVYTDPADWHYRAAYHVYDRLSKYVDGSFYYKVPDYAYSDISDLDYSMIGQSVRSKLDSLIQMLFDRYDNIIVYIACHGASEGIYVIGANGTTGMLFYPKVFKDYLSRYNDKSLVLISDCCYAGKMSTEISNYSSNSAFLHLGAIKGNIPSLGFPEIIAHDHVLSAKIDQMFNGLNNWFNKNDNYIEFWDKIKPLLNTSYIMGAPPAYYNKNFDTSIKIFHPQPSIDIEEHK